MRRSAQRSSPADLERRFNALLEVHGASLARVAGSYVRHPGEREDLVQDVAIAIWRALPAFRGECSERTFVFRIAHNRGISHLARRRPPTTELSEDLDPVDPTPTQEQALATEEQGRRLVAAVQRLSLGYRQVVTLALEGLTYSEIGEVLGLTESNVGARLTRARHLLRTLMQEPHATP